MQSLRSQSIAKQLNSASILIEVSKETPAILAIMLKFGYKPEDFTAAQLLCTAAVAANKKVSADAGDAKEATDAFQKSMVVATGRYADFAKIGRSAYKGDKGVLSLLRIDKRRPKAIDDFIVAADQLYDTTKWTLPVKAKLEKRGITDEWLSSARGEVAEMKLARKHQVDLGGEAEDATDAQTKALKALVDWCQEYIEVARVALKKSPQKLEKLGIKVRNGKSKAQIEGVKKSVATRKLNREKKAVAIHKAA